jgi:hypothetical protein
MSVQKGLWRMDLGTLMIAELAEAAGLFALIVLGLLPGFLMFRLEHKRREDPAFLKRQPIIIVTMKALDSVADVIGRYGGAEIYRYVVFKGTRYEYDRITTPAGKSQIRESELLIPPGVIYRARD